MTLKLKVEKDNTNSRFAFQLFRNLAVKLSCFLVNVIIGVLLVPYFLSTLGVAALQICDSYKRIRRYMAPPHQCDGVGGKHSETDPLFLRKLYQFQNSCETYLC